MPKSTRSWLTVIIGLLIASFIIVTEPVSWGPRPQMDNPKRREPGAFTLGPLNFYVPLPRVRLGLDLQGGSHVVLRARTQAAFIFGTDKVLYTTEADRLKLQSDIVAALPDEEVARLELELGRRSLSVRTEVENEQEAKARGSRITKLLEATPLSAYGPLKLTRTDVSGTSASPRLLRQVADILDRRINRLGLSEATVQTQPPDRIVIQLPGMKDPQQVLDTLQTTAMLQFIHIDKRYRQEEVKGGGVVFRNEKGEDITRKVLAAGTVIMRGDQLRPVSRYQPDASGYPAVGFELTPEGAEIFWEFSHRNLGEVLAVVLDSEVISAPVIRAAIRNQGEITGMSSVAEAQRLSELLNAGALPVPLEIAENRTVGATLGRDSLTRSLYAGLVGMALVLVFMVWYYRLPGVLADAALMVYCLLLLAVLKLFGATLTLPGIAGVIISIGMAVDANVIIFERLKEELRAGKTLKSAIDAGFKRAFTAILDSNVCSIITSLVLMGLGTGAVKGFAITLLIGVACSMFTAITVTRLFMNMASNTRVGKDLGHYGIDLGQLPATGGQGA